MFKMIATTWIVLLDMFGLGLSPVQAVPTQAPVTGEIQRITVNNPADHWTGGTIVIGGQTLILPRNLLLDLPANRLTLKQLFDQASPDCVALGETGLAKSDRCNTSGTGGFATISANRTDSGNIIAGDVLIEKGRELITGTVTFISYTDGYFRLNGQMNNPNTGCMVRLNDPNGRHTIQQGLGCLAGAGNCSPDPRFALDPDNYTNVFSTGYPICIPSTVVSGSRTSGANPLTGAGDPFCPTTNRNPNPLDPFAAEPPVPDSTRFAPIRVGDSITAEGNFETINGVQFLSAHTTMVQKALTTQANQPDFFFLDEVEMDAPGFQDQRARALIIGFATRTSPLTGGADVLFWTVHRDPVVNGVHEFPLASVLGCDRAAGPGSCGAQGLVGAGANIFRIRYDVDFFLGAKPDLNPCIQLRADPRFQPLNICPNQVGLSETNIREMFGVLSPIPHEIQARSGLKLANPGLTVLDIQGNAATWGQYLFPFGINLGGVTIPEFNEIDLNQLARPFIFEGIPWTLDRRLSPNGCIDTTGDGIPDCEAAPQQLEPFPISRLDPRTQAQPIPRLGGGIPTGQYNDPNFTASLLADVSNRILSFVDAGIGKFDGNNTLLSLPFPGTFTDVPPDHFAFNQIEAIAGAGITAGCGVNLFCPDAAVTRGEMAVFIENSLGNPPGACTGRFADVPVTDLFCGFIERLAADGITGGCGGTNFCPDDPVSRGQVAVFIEGALGNLPAPCSGQFADVTLGNPFCGFVERLAADGITSGCGGGNFCPNDSVTRAQMAVFLVTAPAPLLP